MVYRYIILLQKMRSTNWAFEDFPALGASEDTFALFHLNFWWRKNTQRILLHLCCCWSFPNHISSSHSQVHPGGYFACHSSFFRSHDRRPWAASEWICFDYRLEQLHLQAGLQAHTKHAEISHRGPSGNIFIFFLFLILLHFAVHYKSRSIKKTETKQYSNNLWIARLLTP